MLSRSLASLLLVLPAAAACTDEPTVTTKDAARLIAASGPHVVVAASSETEQPSLGCGGGGEPLLGPSVIFVSDNGGETYERVVPTDPRPLSRIGVKDGVFYGIAQAEGATSFAIVTSPDGREWTELASATGTSNDYEGSTYAMSVTDQGIAVAYGTGILTSTDGITWADKKVTEGLYLPSVTHLGSKVVVSTAADNTLRILDDGAWTTYKVPRMAGVWEVLPSGGGLIVTGQTLSTTTEYERNNSIARIDLASTATPAFTNEFVQRPVVAPVGLLDTSGRLAQINGQTVGSLSSYVDPFQSAHVAGNTVQLVRNGAVVISTDGGRTFGAPVALPIESYEHAAGDDNGLTPR